jgi:hypothetical protein
MRISSAWLRFFHGPAIAVALAFVFLAPAGPALAGLSSPPPTAGVSREEALRLGERMYREGILPSGKPLQALLKGDVPVEGSQLTCSSCHQRSGFGIWEGTVRTPPIDGGRLYLPLYKFKGTPLPHPTQQVSADDLIRPAYTDETLAQVLWTGVDPAGRQLNTAMPVYDLSDRDMAIMVYYLKNLSSGSAPGVTDTSVRFATIITDDVTESDRQAMLSALRRYITNRRISRIVEYSVRTGVYLGEWKMRGSRSLLLDVWELKGPPDTWRAQLEAYNERQPVFAILGGITYGDWAPIHRFCEDYRIPAIFPITDFPVISDKDWYTLYLSKGLYQEGETAAKYLNSRDDLSGESSVVQVFRKNPAGLAMSKGFAETWTGLGRRVDSVAVGNEMLTADFWKKFSNTSKHSVVLLWLDAKDFPDLKSLAQTGTIPRIIVASSTLLGQHMYSLPEKERNSVYLTYPYTLPRDARKYRESIEKTLRSNKLPATNLDIEFKMRALFSTMTVTLNMMRNYVYREYFMELIENTPDLPVPVPYPRMSFGPGQRYSSKGCYVIQLSDGPNPELIQKSEWIIH